MRQTTPCRRTRHCADRARRGCHGWGSQEAEDLFLVLFFLVILFFLVLERIRFLHADEMG